jgi:uncharacterized protein YhaN
VKIMRLHLLSFGLFTDTLLDLGGGEEGFHLIYGPNEAGKSSALRAVHQVLYGIPERTFDDFLHPYSKMRIGAVLRRSDGRILDFVRRKGRANTIRGGDDETLIGEDRLKDFLGGVDADLFSTMFGIGHGDLVRGGKEILQGGGNLGRILFAAGSGISDLRRVQTELQAEADLLFKPSAQKPRINEAVVRLRDNRKELREAQLPGQKWAEHDRGLREALAGKRIVEGVLEERVREKRRLERIAEALPAVARRRELLEALQPCADAVLLPPDFGEVGRNLLTRLLLSEKEEEQGQETLREIERAMGALECSDALLQDAEGIEQLYQELGSHLKAERDRGALLIKNQSLQSDAQGILAGLRGGLGLEEVEGLRLSKAENVRIQELSNRYERLITRLEDARAGIERLTFLSSSIEKKIAGLESPRETGRLKKIVEKAGGEAALEESLDQEFSQISRDYRSAEISLGRQRLWFGTLHELETLPLPSMETIDAFEKRLDEAGGAVVETREEIKRVEEDVLKMEGEIRQLTLEQEVPTEEDLMEARRRRENGWRLVRRAWREGVVQKEAVLEFVALHGTGEDLAEAYEGSVRRADDLSDRLRREADRVAKKAGLLAERETCKARLERLRPKLDRADLARENVRREWMKAWEPTGIAPGSPREMRVWTQNQLLLREQITKTRERRERGEAVRGRMKALALELLGELLALGERGENREEPLSRLVWRGQRLLDRQEKIRREREQHLRELAQRGEELQEAKILVSRTERELNGWREDWGKALRPLGLERDASPAQANALVEELKGLFGKLEEGAILRKRIHGIDKDAEDLARRVRALAARLASDLVDSPVERTISELSARLTRARTARTKWEALQKQRLQEEMRLRSARKKISEIKTHLEGMCREAGCESVEGLRHAEERSHRRKGIEQELFRLEEQLRNLGAGATVEEFVLEAQGVDPDGVQAKVARLAEEIEAHQKEKSNLDQTIGRERTELDRMRGSGRAADLAEEEQHLLARLENDVEKYVRLRLASTVLGHAMERYRERNQGPLLRRSSELFSRMTLGSFEGVRVEVTEQGGAVLVGVRSGGKEMVPVGGMREGTADQLYLALRLAGLEMYLERNEPLPFILDDILIQFDDERAAAALKTLARLSSRTQILFFTHHRRLLELAEIHVDPAVLYRHTLGGEKDGTIG